MDYFGVQQFVILVITLLMIYPFAKFIAWGYEQQRQRYSDDQKQTKTKIQKFSPVKEVPSDIPSKTNITGGKRKKKYNLTERQIAYKEYLKSQDWKIIRKKRLIFDNEECQLCGNKHNLQVHHKSYPEDWYDTKVKNLITLCDKCHKRHHSIFRH